ncbi:MAG TPA: hypothetical protein VK534_00955 [Methylomirabilota bacterium]|nr:hypothetical protein [Methylomirabilota bacterium]
MAAEIYHTPIGGEKHLSIQGQVIGEEGIFWISDFGDGQGNETFVHVQDNKVEIFNASRVDSPDNDENQISFNMISSLVTLDVGNSKQLPIKDTEGDVIVINVKNIGEEPGEPEHN